jgi:deazaflavin-dependent oxidoreductase (nitroreductase family)
VRQILNLLNRLVVVPAFRLRLGRLAGNPASGYYMVVRTVGRKSGRTRYAPVTYAIADGCVYCLAGYGRTAHWYRNAMATPDISLLMPAGTIAGHAEEVQDAAERLAATRQIFRNAGLMGFTEGFDPFNDDDDTIREGTAHMPVLRVRPTGDPFTAGAFDPGGRAWLWLPVFALALIVVCLSVRRSTLSRPLE